jgi:hypothetical protein
MPAIARTLVLSLALASALGSTCADDGDLSLGGFICVRPFAPPCANEPATYRRAEAVSACQGELDRFSAAMNAYRDCLERQIGDAFRRANDVLDHFHCLSQQNCPQRGARR